MSALRVLIDGASALLEDDEGASLAEIARRAGATRIVIGCSDGRCGSCRAIVDGALVATCKLGISDVIEGSTIVTATSLDSTAAARAALAAFAIERPTRCKMCVGALAVTASELARELERGGDREAVTERLLEGATCMCTGRGSWRRALLLVR
ncbi:hypothetical protein BH09MYX1_BH09MYX1_64710 [soil metagenome]